MWWNWDSPIRMMDEEEEVVVVCFPQYRAIGPERCAALF